jgi:hypothetical protein
MEYDVLNMLVKKSQYYIQTLDQNKMKPFDPMQ